MYSAETYERQARSRAVEFAPEPARKIAAIVTTYFRYSHADNLVTRFLEGYSIVGRSYPPPCRVASLYIDQTPDTDIGRPLARHYKVPVFDSIAGALTLGGAELAVDGVLIVAEHGSYPFNEKGQHLYPRRQFFEETVKVFEKCGRVVPVFNDKHLSYNWTDAKWIYDTAKRMGIPFMAGSSIPLAYRHPDLQPGIGVEWDGALAVGHGGFESYGFHTLEALQVMAERRSGGETGVQAVQCLEGKPAWEAAAAGRWDRRLLEAAAATVPTREGGRIEEKDAEAIVYVIEYRDGLRAATYLSRGYLREFAFAGRVKEHAQPPACWFEVPRPQRDHFSFLAHNIGRMMVTGEPAYPVERTLLTTGMLAFLVESKVTGHPRIETPELDIQYSVSAPAA